MKKYAASSITLMQFIFIVHGAQVGTGVFTLPLDLALEAGTDGWISLLLGAVCNIAASIMIVKLFQRYPDDTIADLFVRVLGKWLGKIALIPLIVYLVMIAITILMTTILFVTYWFLPLTPMYLIIMLLVFPCYAIARSSIRVLGRYNELVFYMMIWMPFILLIPLKETHWLHLLPIIKEGWAPIIKGMQTTFLSSLGFELTFFLYPFLKHKKYAIQGVVYANLLTLFTYLGVTLICFAYFSPDDITNFKQPLLSLLKVIEFRFLERFDMIFLAFYLFIISSAWLPYVHGAILLSGQLFNRPNRTLYANLFFALIILLVFLFPPSWNRTLYWQEWISKSGIIIAYLLPFALAIGLWIYHRLKRSKAQ